MVTLKEIAEKAGVNLSTVSRALNDSSEINEQTKKIIKEIALQMNYIPNISAKALMGKGSKSVGVIVPEISSIYFSEMLDHMESELQDNGYSLMVGMTHHNEKKEIEYLKIFANRQVDGIIITGSMYKGLKKHLIDFKKNYKIPILLIQTYNPFPDCDYIFIDDVYGYNNMIEYLIRQGHKNIAFISDEFSSQLRFRSFKEAVNKNMLKLDDRFVKIGKERFELGGYLRMKDLLKEKGMPTAIIASYDYIAIGAMRALNEQGIKIPDDISIVGYDNIRESEYLLPSLSTISPPIKEMGRIGVTLLIDKIKNKDDSSTRNISLNADFIVRNSTK